jgi:hypothetical protein
MIFRPLLLCAALLAGPTLTNVTAGAAQPPATSAAAAPSTRPAPRSRNSVRMLLIQSMRGDFPTDDFYIAAKERARPRLTGGGPDALTEDQLDDWLNVGTNGNEITISVLLPASAPPVAAEIADDLVEFARTYLASQYDESRKRALAQAERELAIQEEMAAEANQHLKVVREKLRDLSGRSDVTPKTLTNALSSMDDELQRLQLERLSKDARRRALEEEIAKLSERVQKRIESDPIATEFQKVVDAREESVKTIKQLHEQGQASRADVMQAVAQAAEAKAKLLQQQRDAAAAAGGTALEAFNRELMTLSIDARELDTKTKYLEERLPRLRQAVELLDEYGRIAQRATEANDSLDIVTRRVRDVRAAQKEADPPRVQVKESQNERLE